MRSYPNPFLSREVMIDEARAHREADRLFPGEYWCDGSGCSVGCSIETVNRRMGGGMSHHDHGGLADALGIPEPLVELQDVIYEGLPSDLQQAWPERFYTALPEGADLSGVWPLFATWMLREVVLPVASVSRAVVERMAKGIETNWAYDDLTAANAAARAARVVAGPAAGSAANAAAWAAERAAEWAAERAAARAAERAAAETAAWAAAKLARDAAWTRMSDKLCELMAACEGTVA